MAITRKMLKGMGLTDEQIDTIIEAHTEVTDGLKEQIKSLKSDGESVSDLQKKLEKAESDLAAAKKDSWKVKYDAIKEEFEDYKTEQNNKATHEAKEAAYRDLLKQAGVSEKRIASVLKVSDVDSVELDNDGKVKKADDLIKGIKEEWADFLVTTSTKGADTKTPPTNTGGSATTKDEILKMRDPVARQKAIGDHMDLFTQRKE